MTAAAQPDLYGGHPGEKPGGDGGKQKSHGHGHQQQQDPAAVYEAAIQINLKPLSSLLASERIFHLNRLLIFCQKRHKLHF